MTPATVDTKVLVLEKVKELPPLPLVVHELLAVMRNPNCSADDITRVLSSDQALASRILRLVNSSFYGVPGGVGTISRAVIILGHASLRSLATGLSVVGAVGNAVPPERRRTFWQHALAVAAGAEILSREIGLPEPEESFVAGLLHDIGHLVLMVALPASTPPSMNAACWATSRVERAAMGLDHCRAGRQLMQHWKLPQSLLECVRLHHAPDACLNGESPLLTVVALADRVSRVLGAPGEGIRVEDDVVSLANSLGLSPAGVLEMVPAIRIRMIEARSFLKMAEIEEDLTPAAADDLKRTAVVVSEDPPGWPG